jgi:serine phosphatase RsbU (regulator of sigma subunit)
MVSWAIVLFGFAFRKKLDASLWALAITGIAADITLNLSSIVGLGGRWTHMNGLAARLDAPLFQIAGNAFNLNTICSTLLLVAIVYAVWRHQSAQRQREMRVTEEFRNAQEVQQVLVPKDLPDLRGFTLTAAYRPAQEVGGDFFQLIPLPDDAALLVIGDVSGKGLHAAMTVALIVGALRSAVATSADPAELLATLNRLLHGRLRQGFATCLALRIEAGGECIVANAGHLSPYMNGREVELPPALPLGLIENATYDNERLAIGPEDRLTLCTDGLPEASSPAGELFGFERVSELLARCSDAKQIAEAACRFGQEDDITVVTLERAPVLAMSGAR